MSDDDEFSRPPLERFYNLLSGSGSSGPVLDEAAVKAPDDHDRPEKVEKSRKNAIAVRPHDRFPIPARVSAAFPFLTSPRILFLQPRFESLHDGTCHGHFPEKAGSEGDQPPQQKLCPLTETVGCVQDGVIAEETETGEVREDGDVNECPVYALFQLRETGEILGLVQWDYRD